jgi:hypothetical protein
LSLPALQEEEHDASWCLVRSLLYLAEHTRSSLMGFTIDESMVRVDFFKPSGKWYTTEAVRWTGHYDKGLIHREFAKSLKDHLDVPGKKRRLSNMLAICLEPYHQHAHPIMLGVDEIDAMLADREQAAPARS